MTVTPSSGWTRNGEKVSSESEFVFSLSGSDIVSGQTYEFVADYREAFRFTVISGLGGGKYARDDVINVSAIIPTGNDFRGWMVSFEGEDYFIGRIGTESESVICLISSDGESVKYYSEETGETDSFPWKRQAVTLPVVLYPITPPIPTVAFVPVINAPVTLQLVTVAGVLSP